MATKTDRSTERNVPVTAPPRRIYPRKTDIVLEAAERAFLQSGYANTSMDMVAERAGVSKRTVYSNFGSKDDLFAAVIRKRCADVIPTALDAVDKAGSPEVVLTAMATAFLTAIYSRPQIELYLTVVAESRQFAEIGRIMVEGPIAQSQRLFADVLRAHADTGQLSLPDADLAAAQLIALLKTNVHMRLLFHQDAPTGTHQIAASARSSVQLFLNGARPR